MLLRLLPAEFRGDFGPEMEQVFAEQREEALKRFKFLHGASQILNLIVLGGVLIYLWRVTTPTSAYRFRS
jgi:hypothetical protein